MSSSEGQSKYFASGNNLKTTAALPSKQIASGYCATGAAFKKMLSLYPHRLCLNSSTSYPSFSVVFLFVCLFLYSFLFYFLYQFQPLCLHSGCGFVSSMKINRGLTDKMSITEFIHKIKRGTVGHTALKRHLAAQTTVGSLGLGLG